MKIAMWSGPRNLSTAMMYAFGNRPDFEVVDEPLYAAYLSRTGLDHPMRDEILAAQPGDPQEVIETLTGSHGAPHQYQKHMTQHMLPDFPRDWMADVVNVFLIRHPARVVASFSAKYENPTLEDIGFAQQLSLYETACAFGQDPVVIDSADIRADPQRMLTRLCEALGIAFDADMLRWPRGGHPSDGVWSSHWYGAVHNSTGFAGPEGALPELNGDALRLVEEALPFYEVLHSRRLR